MEGVPTSIFTAMERWAENQPTDLPTILTAAEVVFVRLDLAGLFDVLLKDCSARARKQLSYLGGIRCSPEDLGWPATYASTECYTMADGSEQTTRDPGDELWAHVFDELVKQHPLEDVSGLKHLSMDRKGDMLELTLGAAMCVLDVNGRVPQQPSVQLQRCLHCARLLIEDLARTTEEIYLRLHPASPLLQPKEDGVHVSSKTCPRCQAVIFGKWRYPTWTGAITPLFQHECRQ